MSKKVWWIITALLFALTVYYVIMNGNFDETPFATHGYGTGVVRPKSPYRIKVWLCFFASCITCCMAINAKPGESTAGSKAQKKKIKMPAERIIGLVLTGFIVFLYFMYYVLIPVENRGVLPSPFISIAVAGLGLFLIYKSFKKGGNANQKTSNLKQPTKAENISKNQSQNKNYSDEEAPLDDVWE